MKSGKHPGRIRWRLSELLLAKGLIVSPYDLWTQDGGYRHRHWDLARWGSNHARFVDGLAPDGSPWDLDVHLSSWSRMTDCVRFGVEIGKEDECGTWWWVGVERAGMKKSAPRA